jgi:Protein of unknown function (DUF2934)
MPSQSLNLEERIRVRAYYLWDASGRPSGRDEEFWYKARELMLLEGDPRASKPRARRGQRISPKSSGLIPTISRGANPG